MPIITLGTAGDDIIDGTAGIDYLRGLDGDDILNGGSGVDYLRGGAGADVLNGELGADWGDYSTSSAAITMNLDTNVNLGGDAEGDTLFSVENIMGSRFDDSITGNARINYLRGWKGDDALFGGDNKDYLQGDAGADALDGGSGSDWAYYISSDAGVDVNLLTGVALGGHAQGDTFTSIENLFGSNFDDTLTGDAGNNYLKGRMGDDILNGGDGNDFLLGNEGADTMDGGAGVDWVTYLRAATGVTVQLDGTASSGGEAEGDIITNVERAEGSMFGDMIFGNSGANYLRGRDGDDTLSGGDGNDFLQGDGGADTLEGGNGTDMAYYASSTVGVTVDLGNTANNTGEAAGDIYSSIEGVFGSKFDDNITGDSGDNILRGFLGDDIINGGQGNDTLRGEAGADTFVFDFGNGNDVVIDYNDAEDMLDLTDFGFGSVASAMNFASDVSGDVVFDFGAGGMFTIEDTTTAEIMDNIII